MLISIRDLLPGRNRAAEDLEPLTSPSLEILESRVLLSAGSLPTETLVPSESSLGTAAINVDLDHVENNRNDDLASALTYCVSSDGTCAPAPEVFTSESVEEGRTNDNSRGETAPSPADSPLASAAESPETLATTLSETQAALYTLTVTADQGSVFRYPEKALYDAGEVVYLIPRPQSGYCFQSWSGDVTGGQRVAQVTMDRAKTITAHFDTWQPPLGIPVPPFGITTTHWMYAQEGRTYDFGSGPQPYPVGPDGPYTHYVDPRHPDATDTGNPYGTHTKPRVTVPSTLGNLPAGSVVELHGDLGNYGTFDGLGTAEAPIFIRGPSTGDRPIVYGPWLPRGRYTVFENLVYDLRRQNRKAIDCGFTATRDIAYLAFRNLDVRNMLEVPAGSNQALRFEHTGTYTISNIVVYNCLVHHCGEGRTENKYDHIGVSVRVNVSDVWIVDNCFHTIGGDGIQVDADNLASASFAPHHIYIGRNVGHDLFENFLDLKNCRDVIISQNTAFNLGPAYSSVPGGGAAFRYGIQDQTVVTPRQNIWTLCNEVFRVDCNDGAMISYNYGDQEPFSDHIYYIGNLIHDCVSPTGRSTGISWWYQNKTFLLYNTIWNCNRPAFLTGETLYNPPSEQMTVIGNIFGEVVGEDPAWNINLLLRGTTASLDRAVMQHNLFYRSSAGPVIRQGVYVGPGTVYSEYSFDQYVAAFPGRAVAWTAADPLLVDAGGGDFRLQAGSPALDAGSSAVVEEVLTRFQQLYGLDIRQDLAGQSRTGVWELGAYAYLLPAVTDLAVSGPSQNSLTLTWTVPGAPGVTGTPAGYDLRYAPSPITETTWATATPVPGEPVAGGLGQSQSFTITGLTPGTPYYLALKVLDEAGYASALSNLVAATTTTSGNRAPVLQPIGDRSVVETATLIFSISAADADGDSLTYSAANLPTGASFTTADRTFTWRPTNLQSGRYRVMFQVTDGQVTVSETVTITVRAGVNQPPALASIGSKSVNENASLSLTLSATDPDGDSLTFSATGLPSGAGLTNGVFNWTPSYDQSGSYEVTFNVSDGELTDSERITITVADISDRTAPSAQADYPGADAFQVPVNPLIILTISDAGSGVDASTVAIRINNQLVYTGDSSLYESASGICRRTGTRASYHYYYQAAKAFDFDQQITVQINASDAVHNVMVPYTYQFATEMRSFSRNQLVSASGDNAGRPTAATDSQGNLWTVWHAGAVDARDIYVAKRGGTPGQWGAPVRLTNLASDQCHPALAVGPDDRLYVAWQDNRRGNWDIYLSTSSDGSTWGDAVRVTDSDHNQMSPVIAVDQVSPHYVYIAWERGNPGGRDIYLASSNTLFATKTITQVTSDPADQTDAALAVGSDNAVYLVWADQRNGSGDIYGSSSTVSSWANVPIVTGPGNQFNPALGVEPGTSLLHVLWADDAAGNLDVVHGTSNDLPGSPLSGTIIVDDTTHANQSAPVIVTARDHWNNAHVYACWQDSRTVGSAHDTDLYLVELRSGVGATNILVGDDGTNSNQSDPALGYDEHGQPVVIWTDDRDGTLRIYGTCSVYMKPTALASASITRAAGGRVGADPAAITKVGDVSIQILPTAYDCDVAISISEIQNLPRFTSFGVAGYEIGPSGLQFAFPATITIPYASSGLGQKTPYWYDAQAGVLSQQGMSDVTYRTLANGIPVISFKTTHLTTFYVLETPVPVSASGGGGCALSHGSRGDVAGFFVPYAGVVLLLLILKRRDYRCKRI